MLKESEKSGLAGVKKSKLDVLDNDVDGHSPRRTVMVVGGGSPIMGQNASLNSYKDLSLPPPSTFFLSHLCQQPTSIYLSLTSLFYCLHIIYIYLLLYIIIIRYNY